MQKPKKILALLLAAVMLLSVAVGCTANPPDEITPQDTPQIVPVLAQQDTLTRARWIQMLATAMHYTYFDDLAAFFDDVPPTHPAHSAIQSAVVFSAVEIDESGLFHPDDTATRAFVAASAARAVGLVGEPEVAIDDIAGLSEAQQIRLAVDNEIIDLQGGANFNPDGEVSITQAQQIAARITALTTIDLEPISHIVFREGVVDFSDTAAEITHHDPDAMRVTVPAEIGTQLEVGTVYILPPSGAFPTGIARTVVSITEDGGNFIIENAVPELYEFLEEFEIADIFVPDWDNIILADGVTMEILTEDIASPASASSPLQIQRLGANTSPQIEQMALPFDARASGIAFDLGALFAGADAASISGRGTFVIHELHATGQVQLMPNPIVLPGIPPVLVSGRLDGNIRYSTQAEFIAAVTFDLPIARIPLTPVVAAPVAAIWADLTLNASGGVDIVFTKDATAEFGARVTANVVHSRYHRPIHTEADIAVDMNAIIGLTTSLRANVFGVGDVLRVFADAGVHARFTGSVLDMMCADLDWYLAAGVEVQVLSLLPYRHPIFHAQNSPLRRNQHFENNVPVPRCTRGTDGSVFAQITPEEVTRTPGGSQQFSLVIRGGEGDELVEWVVSGLDADLELIAPDQVPPRANSRTRHINILPDIPPQEERTARVYVEALVRSAEGELLTSAEAVLNIDLRAGAQDEEPADVNAAIMPRSVTLRPGESYQLDLEIIDPDGVTEVRWYGHWIPYITVSDTGLVEVRQRDSFSRTAFPIWVEARCDNGEVLASARSMVYVEIATAAPPPVATQTADSWGVRISGVTEVAGHDAFVVNIGARVTFTDNDGHSRASQAQVVFAGNETIPRSTILDHDRRDGGAPIDTSNGMIAFNLRTSESVDVLGFPEIGYASGSYIEFRTAGYFFVTYFFGGRNAGMTVQLLFRVVG